MHSYQGRWDHSRDKNSIGSISGCFGVGEIAKDVSTIRIHISHAAVIHQLERVQRVSSRKGSPELGSLQVGALYVDL